MRRQSLFGYREIYNRYKKSILSGALKPAEKVSSIRALAYELGVAKGTVESAYDILISEGYLISNGPRGTFVNPALIIERQEAKGREKGKSLSTSIRISESAPGKHFVLGVPAFDAFPKKKWLNVSAKVVKEASLSEFNNPDPRGEKSLRHAIAAYLSISRGLECDPDQIIVTSGYPQSIQLILRTLFKNKEKLVLEEPGYFLGHEIMKRENVNYNFSPVNEGGLNVDYFLKKHGNARGVLVTPAHQSPLTHSMALPRRYQLLNWAVDNEAWIVEDDYDGEFHYTKKQIPALKNLDRADRVIYLGTFSKTLLPSLRTSYLVIPKTLQNVFYEEIKYVMSGQPRLIQKIIARFITEGHFYRHLRKMRSLYPKRRAMVIAACKKVFKDKFYFESHEGGLHLVAFLDGNVSDIDIARKWQECGLDVKALSDWYSSDKKKQGLVMGFTNIRSESEAIRLFSRVQRFQSPAPFKK